MEHRKTATSKTAPHYDVIVVGVGSMGSAACWFLAKRGYKVLGLEKFTTPHEQGSHTGQSRLVRKSYFEHPDYVPLLARAYQNWRLLEAEMTSTFYQPTGILYAGKPDHETMSGLKQSAAMYQIPLKKIPPSEAGSQYPLFRFPSDFEVILEADAGFVSPENTIIAYSQDAIKKGATILTNSAIDTWKVEAGRVEVKTDSTTYTSDKLIITAGAWTSQLIPALPTSLTVTRQVVAWLDVEDQTAFALGDFPCWLVEDPELGTFYGFPVLPSSEYPGPTGLKLAHHFPGEKTNPDFADRSIQEKDAEALRHFVKNYIPAAGHTFRAFKSCLYTNSVDRNFIIDQLPGYDNRVTVACGFSGHGFKFVPVVGEILADLAMKGRTDLPIHFLRLNRF
ncbi:N-methyl-L-tryptophan oxidase [Larkinella rosea]|uniref:N-methyl-L-tryptophan oxidase n=1 Tax=Larkinella rosea TaxID=2025312 RepID=UPI00163AEB5A|nr:N-methyl-L-tryptophan oxidase [Larkinella rosea]